MSQVHCHPKVNSRKPIYVDSTRLFHIRKVSPSSPDHIFGILGQSQNCQNSGRYHRMRLSSIVFAFSQISSACLERVFVILGFAGRRETYLQKRPVVYIVSTTRFPKNYFSKQPLQKFSVLSKLAPTLDFTKLVCRLNRFYCRGLYLTTIVAYSLGV